MRPAGKRARPLGRTAWRRRDRGQVLLVAVMVLFGVATLAALFAAIVGAQIVQVSRYADVTALRNVAEAGLRLANQQLVYSKSGADWRPDRTHYQVGNGLVALNVSYSPMPGNLQSRFLMVSATATFPDNPFLSYTIVGVKPLLLTDYARFITDRDELRQPATLGTTGVELGGQRRDGNYGGEYQLNISGPIRANTDLVWYGQSRALLSTSSDTLPGGTTGQTWASLGIMRDDRIEVAGRMRSGASFAAGSQDPDPADLPANLLQLLVNGTAYADNVFAPVTDKEKTYYTNGFFDITQFTSMQAYTAAANSWRVLALLPEYQPTFGDRLYPFDYSVPRVNPPRIDAVDPDMDTNRYLILTRDSGEWSSDASYNSGRFGWGWVSYGGIYIDNETDIQYQHDLEKLRLNWVGSYGVPGADGRPGTVAPGNWWDKTGRYYAPPGVEIILHGEATCPYLEIIRDDLRVGPDGVKYYWQGMDGAPIPYDGAEPATYTPPSGKCAGPTLGFEVEVQGGMARFPFPPNGVIYSEGNVRISGVMPPNRGGGQYFPADPSDPDQRDMYSRMYRNHDLQVVSGGTIYVEGDLLGPRSAGLYVNDLGSSPGAQTLTEWDRDYGSRLALIARDHVCLNTTAFHPRPRNLYSGGETRYNDDHPIYPDPDTNGYPPYLLFQGTREEAVNDDFGALTNNGRQGTDPGSIEFLYRNVRLQTPSLSDATYLQDLRLIMGHSGWHTPDVGGVPGEQTAPLEHAEAAAEVELQVNGAVRPWQNGAVTYTFKSEGNEPEDGSSHWYLEPDRSAPFDANDYLEWLPLLDDQAPPQPIQAMNNLGLTGADRLRFSSWILPVWNEDANDPQWIIRPRELGYVLGPLAITPRRGQTPLPVRVEAMVYAQNGSWFVLPGPWFNEDPDSTIDATQLQQELYPTYHEPLNIEISFLGAISENMPAPVGEVADWTSKWSGPFSAGASAGESYLRYEYDPLLRWATRVGGPHVYPRFPGLPLTPDLLIWGERISGFTEAGV